MIYIVIGMLVYCNMQYTLFRFYLGFKGLFYIYLGGGQNCPSLNGALFSERFAYPSCKVILVTKRAKNHVEIAGNQVWIAQNYKNFDLQESLIYITKITQNKKGLL